MENDKDILRGAVRVKSYRIRQDGMRGRVVTLPKDFLDEMQLRPEDRIAFYRKPDSDILMIVVERAGAEVPTGCA
jgi:hypothetical protein